MKPKINLALQHQNNRFFVLTKCFFCDIISTLRKQPHIWRDIEAVITGKQDKTIEYRFGDAIPPKARSFASLLGDANRLCNGGGHES
jgi:hypothetical protein